MQGCNRYHGAALMSALFIMIICAMLATMLIKGQRFLIHQIEMLVESDQLNIDLQSGQEWAKSVLMHHDNLKKIKSLDVNYRNAHVTAQIFSAQGLFNLNRLRDTRNQDAFIRLILATDPKLTSAQAAKIVRYLIAWFKPRDQLNDIYLKAKPAYQASNMIMVSPSELRLVAGITPELDVALAPFVVALPNSNNRIDINYAPAEVLLTASDKMKLSQAKTIIACRDKQGYFKSIPSFLSLCAPQAHFHDIVVNGSYYIVQSQVTLAGQTSAITSMLSVRNRGHKRHVMIVWQESVIPRLDRRIQNTKIR